MTGERVHLAQLVSGNPAARPLRLIITKPLASLQLSQIGQMEGHPSSGSSNQSKASTMSEQSRELKKKRAVRVARGTSSRTFPTLRDAPFDWRRWCSERRRGPQTLLREERPGAFDSLSLAVSANRERRPPACAPTPRDGMRPGAGDPAGLRILGTRPSARQGALRTIPARANIWRPRTW